MSKRIPLTQGKFAIVDDDMYEYLNQWKWFANRSKNLWYAIRGIKVNGKRKKIKMHRVIMKAKIGQNTDHKNRNSLDNRTENLRFCNQSQNIANSRARKNCSSKYKGVCWARRMRKWHSGIQVHKKQIHLGWFDSEIEAAKEYNKAALKYFGEFASINFSGVE